MKREKILTRGTRGTGGFTLVEVMISTSLAVLVAAAAYTLLTATLKLYAENFSLNHSHDTARLPLERMIREISNAGSAPILVTATGADTSGVEQVAGSNTRWAPGIRFCTLASLSAYSVTSSATSAATTVQLRVNAGQPKPRESDILFIHASELAKTGNGIQTEVLSVSGTSSPFTVTLKSALGIAVSANSTALLLQQGAFITVNGQVRYYNKVMSEARHGATAFNAAANYRILAQVEPTPGQPEARPFAYTAAEDRLLRVDLRARTGRHSKRVGDFNSFLNMQSSIAVKSAYLDPTKLPAIK